MLNNPSIARTVNAEQAKSYYLYTIKHSETELPLAYTNYDEPVPYLGLTYKPIPIKHSDLSQDSDGKIGDVTLTVGNADRMVQYYLEHYDLIGKEVVITQVFDGIDDVIETTFRIKAATGKKDVATFTLSIGFDVLKMKTPGRKMYARYCSWTFRDFETCKYLGPAIDCEMTWEDCCQKGNSINFGGFPGVISERFYF